MFNSDDPKDMDSDEFRSEYGTTEKKIEIPQKVKKELEKEIIELETESQVSNDEITFGHGLLIMAQRSKRAREIRKDDDLRLSF